MLLSVSLGLLLCFGQVSGEERPEEPTKTHSCDRVRAIPEFLKDGSHMRLDDTFYKKYTEAYGIPIISSNKVPDDALKRACYVVRFLAADNARVRNAVYKNWGRVGVMATTEHLNSIPERRTLDPTWNSVTRAMGPTKDVPIAAVPGENLLCDFTDAWYRYQDIMVHEMSHTIHLLGAVDVIKGWDDRLKTLYMKRKQEDYRWADTYSMSTYLELFAEGAQSYFNVNSYSSWPNGREGPINTRKKLKAYDPPLYSLIKQVFPCENQILDRCNTTREKENNQVLEMDCEFKAEEVDDSESEKVCGDSYNILSLCKKWATAEEGYCNISNEWHLYMKYYCMKSCCWASSSFVKYNKQSCGMCPPCTDKDEKCDWATSDYCSDSVHMTEYCERSCNICLVEETEDLTK